MLFTLFFSIGKKWSIFDSIPLISARAPTNHKIWLSANKDKLEVESMIVQEIRSELEKHSNPEEKEKRIRWEKQHQEMPKLYGIPSSIVRKQSSIFFQKIKKKPKHEILGVIA